MTVYEVSIGKDTCAWKSDFTIALTSASIVELVVCNHWTPGAQCPPKSQQTG